MACIKCGSERVIKFIDGLGKDRFYCKTCKKSYYPTKEVKEGETQLNLKEVK